MNFERGKSPKESMSIGLKGKAKEWLQNHNLSKAKFNIEISDSKITVEITEGEALFKDLDTSDSPQLKKFKIEFKQGKEKVTIVSELDDIELYKRIKNIVKDMLKNCLGKSKEIQEEWIYGQTANAEIGIVLKNLDDLINKAKDYFHKMNEIPTEADLKNLGSEILQGKLEFLLYAKPGINVFFNEARKRFS